MTGMLLIVSATVLIDNQSATCSSRWKTLHVKSTNTRFNTNTCSFVRPWTAKAVIPHDSTILQNCSVSKCRHWGIAPKFMKRKKKLACNCWKEPYLARDTFVWRLQHDILQRNTLTVSSFLCFSPSSLVMSDQESFQRVKKKRQTQASSTPPSEYHMQVLVCWAGLHPFLQRLRTT